MKETTSASIYISVRFLEFRRYLISFNDVRKIFEKILLTFFFILDYLKNVFYSNFKIYFLFLMFEFFRYSPINVQDRKMNCSRFLINTK